MSDIKNTFAENTFLEVLKKLKGKLSKAQEDEDEMDLQDYGLSEEDLQGLSVQDEPLDEDDEAARWLREQEGQGAGEEETAQVDQEKGNPQEEAQQEAQPQKKKVGKGSFKDWEPHGEYTPEQEAKMQQFMDEGYTHREAEKLAGAHKGPTDFQSALKHNVWPSQMSNKHMGELKEIASHWIDNKDRMDKLEADPEKAPMKHAAGQAMKAHEEATKDYAQAYNEFLQSDELKDLKGRKRFQAIRDWKNKWHEENPEHSQKLAESNIQQHFKEAGSVGGGPTGAAAGAGRTGRMGESINERIDRIAGVGHADVMSSEEAAQHVGGVKTDMGTQASQVRDPLSGGAIHAKQREIAQRERQARTQSDAGYKANEIGESIHPKQVSSARKDRENRAEGVIRRSGNVDRVKKLLEQHGKPEQLDRFVRLRSAKASQGGGKQEGEE